MIHKKYLKNIFGIVEDIFIPQIYDNENSEYYYDSEVNLIGFIILTNDNKKIKFVITKDDNNSSIYVGDEVNIEVYELLYNYKNYKSKLYEKIYLENSYLSDLEIKNIFYKNLISETEFNKNPASILEYKISLKNK